VDRKLCADPGDHAENEVTAVYDRHRYDREKRYALEVWAARPKEIVEPPIGNVMSLRGRDQHHE
jgi:hypothetical protein